MTDIKDLLDRASDIPVTVDVASDVRRGQAAARRRRARCGAAAAGVVLVAGAAVVGVVAVSGGDGRRAVEVAESTGSPATSPTTSPSPSPTTSPTPGPVATPIDAVPVDPATLLHTDFFDVPPAPQGWTLVGAQASYVMFARSGSGASLTGGFRDRLMVLLSPDVDADDRPGADWTPLTFDGLTFYRHDGGGGADQVWVQRDDGDWLNLQYPRAAGFALPDMVAFLAAVQVLPGAMAVS